MNNSIKYKTNSIKKIVPAPPSEGGGFFLPINLNLTNRRILVIGGGKVAFHKATILSRFVDELAVLSPRFEDGFRDLPFYYITKSYESGDIDNFDLLYICTDNHALNRRIKEEAAGKGILASVCDAPALCDFTSPAIYRNENLTIAVATNATDVKRSITIRNRIQELIENGILSID